jgi:NTP pyrophosphatase (non-canonical NTP hydrolase)
MQNLTPNEYQTLALLTEHTPDFVRLSHKDGTPYDAEHNMMVARSIHACLGLMSEVGEVADALKKHLIYDRALDQINVMEESGDVSWYLALLLSAVKRTMQEAMDKNIAKLKQRFGDKFDYDAATKRDLVAERKILEE